MSEEILILGKEAFDKLKPDVQRFIKQQSQQIADLETKLAEKDKAIENWQTMYESVMQTCHNDKEEIERLNKQLTQWTINAGCECGEKEKALRLIENLQQEQIAEMKEHQEAMELADKTITNLVEDNRASQEWYKKQLADTEEQNKRVLEKLELIVSANQELEQKLAESEKKHLLDEKEWQDYCSFKHIEPQIKGCLDREKELKQQLAEKEKEISNLKGLVNERDKQIKNLKTNKKRMVEHKNNVKISFAVEQLEQLKHDIWTDQQDDGWLDEQVDIYFLTETIDNQIKRLTHQHEDKGERK